MNPNFSQDPMTFVIALVGGMVPSIIWLWYWIKEDDIKKPPLALVGLTFITGMLMVVLVIPIQKFMEGRVTDYTTLIVVWVICEEVLKLVAFGIIAYASDYIEEQHSVLQRLKTHSILFAQLECRTRQLPY